VDRPAVAGLQRRDGRPHRSEPGGRAGRPPATGRHRHVHPVIDARSQPDAGLAAFYRARFRPEFKPAFAAWLTTRPFTNQDAPTTPFAMPQYRLAAMARAERLERTAAAASERAKDANQRADNFMLAVVLFASALFFAGISTKLDVRAVRVTMLGLAGLVLVGTLVWIATFPIRLTA
jgi:hypothetical protein